VSAVPFAREVDTLYAAGVTAVQRVTADFTAADWARPACGTWTGTELAGHLVTVIGWYHDWLDRAEAGDASPAFPATELDAHTAADLAALPAGTGPERIAVFADRADAYRARLHEHWDLPYGYPRGTVTAGQHAALAAWEWHVHAWDFATAAGGSSRPDDAATLYARGNECFTAATGVEVPPAEHDPWIALLHRSGRTA
jgi:hypothetical protein